jgi:histidyl-tRNA synthetase
MSQLSTQPYKGTRDFYPEDMRIRNWMFGRLRDAVSRFGYLEYDGPMLEPFDLYAAKSGEELVNQQLYWLVDKGERKLAVRPEMTPTMARMVAAKVNELPKPVRWFAIPNLWRYERPQRGRLREHWQLNVDVIGGDALLADAEILTVALDLMRAFGGEKHISIKVNNRRLMDHFFKEVLGLTPETALATTKAIDARAKIGEEAYAKWLGDLGLTGEQRDRMEGFFAASFDEITRLYPCQGSQELAALFAHMRESGMGDQVVFDATVLRGLDYYTGTVFEIYDVSPENRRALFGGGRYDDILGLFGKTKVPGVGFGMGDVGLQNFLEVHGLLPKFEGMVDVFVSLPRADALGAASGVARSLREAGLRVVTPLEVGGFGAQLKLATKHGARFAVLFGDTELAAGNVLVKDLASGEQVTVAVTGVAGHVKGLLARA